MRRIIDADVLNTDIESEFDGVCVYDVSGREAASDMQDIVDRQPEIMLDYEHRDMYTDMIRELLDMEERNDYFNLTTFERAEFQKYVEERMEL